jgi:hypothetical protein
MKTARPIIDKFVKNYRRNLYNGMPENVPTACTLDGTKNLDIIHTETFRLIKKLYVLFESPDELYVASGEDVLGFYDSLEPWEDYDFCVFDDSLNWCIGVTHNEDVIVIDKTSVLSNQADGDIYGHPKYVKD